MDELEIALCVPRTACASVHAAALGNLNELCDLRRSSCNPKLAPIKNRQALVRTFG